MFSSGGQVMESSRFNKKTSRSCYVCVCVARLWVQYPGLTFRPFILSFYPLPPSPNGKSVMTSSRLFDLCSLSLALSLALSLSLSVPLIYDNCHFFDRCYFFFFIYIF